MKLYLNRFFSSSEHVTFVVLNFLICGFIYFSVEYKYVVFNDDDSIVIRGLAKRLIYVMDSFRTDRRPFFDLSTKILIIPLPFLSLIGFVGIFSSIFLSAKV